MNTLSAIYNSKWCINFAPHYVFAKDGKMYNARTGRYIPKRVKGYTVGYNILGRFYSLPRLRGYIVKIQKEKLPF